MTKHSTSSPWLRAAGATALLAVVTLAGCSTPAAAPRVNHNSYEFQQRQAAEAQRQLEREQ